MAPWLTAVLAGVLLVSFLVIHVAGSAACYYPDGNTINPKYFACDPAAAQSACCYHGDSCVDGGLCFGNYGFLYRGGCTDSTWKDSACQMPCTAQNRDTFMNVLPCNADSGLFCCFESGTSGCCNDTFHAVPGTITASVLLAGIATSPVSSATSSAPSSPASNTVTVTGSSSASCTALPSGANAPKGSVSATTVGAAVGAPLGAAFLAARAFALYQRSLRKRAENQTHIARYDPVPVEKREVPQPGMERFSQQFGRKQELDWNNGVHELPMNGRM